MLRTFALVAEAGNILRAAEKRGRTASAVSMKLKQLEEEIGGPLFEGDRKSKLTTLGKHVLSVAQAEIESFNRALASINSFAQNQIGRVELATVPSIGHRIMGTAISSFLKDRPEIELELHDFDTNTIVSFVEAGNIDFGICGQPAAGAQVAFDRLLSDKFVVVCRDDHPLAALSRPLKKNDLQSFVVIANGTSEGLFGNGIGRIAGRPKLMVRNTSSLLALVQQNIGVTVMPELSIPPELGLRLMPFANEDGAVWRDIGLIQKKDAYLSPAAIAFRDHLTQAIRSFSDQNQLESGVSRAMT